MRLTKIFNFLTNSFKASHFRVLLYLILVSLFGFYLSFFLQFSFPWLLNKQFDLVTEQMIVNSGWQINLMHYPVLGFYALGISIASFLEYFGVVINMEDLASMTDPLIFMMQYLKYNRYLMCILTLITIYNLNRIFKILHISFNHRYLLIIMLLSIQSMIYSTIIYNIEIFVICMLSFMILFITKSSREFQNSKKQVMELWIAGIFWGISFLTLPTTSIFLLPILLLIMLHNEMDTVYISRDFILGPKTIFIFSIAVLALLIVARVFNIPSDESVINVSWGMREVTIFFTLFIILLNSFVIHLVAGICKNKYLKIILSYLFFGFLSSALIYFVMGYNVVESLVNFISHLKVTFFLKNLNPINNNGIWNQITSNFLFNYNQNEIFLLFYLMIFLISLMMYFNKRDSFQAIIVLILIIYSLSFISYVPSYFDQDNKLIVNFMTIILPIFVIYKIWHNKSIYLKYFTNILMICVILYNLHGLVSFKEYLIDISSKEHNITEELPAHNFTGQQVKFSINLENRYGNLSEFFQNNKNYWRQILFSIDRIDLLLGYVFPNLKISLTDLVILSRTKQDIAINNQIWQISNIPKDLHNQFLLNMKNLFDQNESSIKIRPIFLAEIYLFTDVPCINNNMQKTQVSISSSFNNVMSHYHGCLIKNETSISQDIIKNGGFFVIQNLY